LKYMLPRLTGKGSAMSRLAGGIGGRGPGETKLEVDRRRVKERIHHIESQLKEVRKARAVQKKKRLQRHVPIVSIVGYTNAGKSTLLNNLTNSDTYVEQRMFATLDTTTRRLRFPKDREIIITDTVGFIRDLPEELVDAFRATLDELNDADLLVHVVDISSPRFEAQIESVERILRDLGLDEKPRILVFNKIDLVDEEMVRNVLNRYEGVAISALNRETFYPLIEAIERQLWKEEPAKEKVLI
ncbi:MAG: GTPase HflX, partial [Nitrospirae bacterium]